MHHNWSEKEIIRFYEIQLEKGTISEGGAAYKRMLKFKDKLEEQFKKKRMLRMRRMNKLMQSKNGKSSK